jgi:multicomponent Na+:H+ antiporter subunit D
MTSATWSTLPWALVLVVLPLAGGIACFALPRRAGACVVVTVVGVAIGVILLGVQLSLHGVWYHAVGGWRAPLGIDLRADGLSLVMLAMTVLVGGGVSLYASRFFGADDAARFWPLWLLLLAALNALFLSADLFNLYVTLELTGLAAVALTALQGGREALVGAMRYLLATLLGSLAYLMGVALLYHAYGTVDLVLLAQRVSPMPATFAALGLMSAGLMLKTALFPLHFWLPPAHASAPAPVSAVLSALVVKGSFYILLRLWLELFQDIAPGVAGLFGLLGAAAVLWGSVLALQQQRVKLLVAYSTVAQVGYFFMAWPLLAAAGDDAWVAVAFLVFSHGLAKAAMFLAAGNVLLALRNDRIDNLARLDRILSGNLLVIAAAGLSLAGMPPAGGFVAKWWLLNAALQTGQWWWGVAIVAGGLLAAAYMIRVLRAGLSSPDSYSDAPLHRARELSPIMVWSPAVLAVGAVAIGLAAAWFGPLSLKGSIWAALP